PPPCPRSLLRLLLPPPRPPRPSSAGPTAGGATAGGAHGRGLVQFVLAAHEGQRNTRLFWAACRAYEDGIGPELTADLITAAVRTGLTSREARGTITSAARMTTHRLTRDTPGTPSTPGIPGTLG
ncbi:primase alpha helix C-terminal domain-containing protein, partial [Streptomyces sp. IBSBF 2806]|uniref:primase alpha helix C-terminal domain-containing protein n=1 Tax=Streptomyces sp. IBSBF 2806 TaxID=2903529 RepID=UPI002FDBD5E8